MRKILLAVAFFACSLGFAGSIEALPGDSLPTAIRKYNRNSLFRGVEIKKEREGFGQPGFIPVPVESYGIPSPSPIRYGTSRLQLGLTIHPDKNGRVVEESITTVPGIANIHEQENYNPRQDPKFIELIAMAWGQAIANDFASSRFTDNYQSLAILHVYEGKNFAYSVVYTLGLRGAKGDVKEISITALEHLDGMRSIINTAREMGL
jgi:hypothetical protein